MMGKWRRKPSRWLGIVAGVLIAGVMLYALARAVDWPTTWQYMRQVNLLWLSAALLALLVNNWAKAMRWRLLFPLSQSPPRRGEVFGVLMAGQLLNFTLPFRGGDISRAYFMGRYRGRSSAAALGSIGAEKLLDIIIMGVLFTLALPFFILPQWLESNRVSIWLISAFALLFWGGIVMVLPKAQAWLEIVSQRWPVMARPARWAHQMLEGLRALRHRERLAHIILWSFVAWVGSIAATYALLASLALPASLPLAIMANVIVQGGMSVPVAPAGVGVFEWLSILALSLAGIPAEQGLAYGLITHAAVLFYPVLVGIPWLIVTIQASRQRFLPQRREGTKTRRKP